MSKSKVKRNISAEALSTIFDKHNLGQILNFSELTGGAFNTVYKVNTHSGKFVIKISPKESTEVLTYEKNLIKTEVSVYELLQNTKTVHFPKIYGYNYADDFEYKYLIMEFIEGDMLCNLNLNESEYNKVMFDLGVAMAELHSVANEISFGYIQNGLKSTMKEAYRSMVDTIITDGLKKTKHIPYHKEIVDIIDKYDYVFDSIKEPSLVHFDLWAGNIIIKEGKFYAIIDCERAMFSDVVGDFISLDYAAPFDVNANKHLIDGYNSVSEKKLSFNKEEMIRLYLFKIYLGLIIYIETYYRTSKYSAEYFSRTKFGKKILKTAIKQLNN